LTAFFATLCFLIVGAPAWAAELELNKGDHVSILGNTLADRMQHAGHVEARIQNRYPEHELSFRNLGFSGDELTLRLRSADFGSPDEWLTRTRADVVWAMFGYNESFGAEAGLDKFRADLDAFVKHTLAQKYNGESAPRLVLFSPIAHENLEDRNLPDGKENNRRLALYTAAMADVARDNGVLFVDLYTPTLELYRTSTRPLTINGVHLNDHGYEMLATLIERALFPAGPQFKRDAAQLEPIRQAVLDKNFHWFQRYRTTDGYSVFGGRSHLKFVDGQTNREVAQREMEVLDMMTANRDRKIWAVAQGREYTVDDGNTPTFIPVVTNKPGPLAGGKHVFQSAELAINNMTVAEGMQVNLFASEEQFPELASPVQMAFDTKGRLWVAAWPTYPHWQPKVEEMNDKLLIFEDTDGDGKADEMKVFADHLHNPTGFEFWGGGVIVGQAPDLVFLKDTDGDDKADVRERILHGLDSADTHHTSNSFTLGPGGALYFQEGTFHHTQVETPYRSPVRSANAGVFRYEPRTQKFDVYIAYGFANPHGHVFDAWGQDFVTDGTGNVNYFAAPFSGHLEFPKKHSRYFPFFQQWVRPCAGTEILSSRHFPAENQGNYLVANVIGYQGILQYKFEDDGSGFKGVETERIVFSSDPNFRPTDIEIGPDGAIYFLDWQNPIIGHMQHNLRDPSRDKIHGRVYRITYKDRPLLTPPKIAGEPIPALLDLLKSPENRVRYRARIELSGRDSEAVVTAAHEWMKALDKSDKQYQHHLLETLWVHQQHNVANYPLLERLLNSPDYRARAAATRVLCYQREKISNPLALLHERAGDEHPRVRLEAVRACSFFEDGKAAEVALQALKHPADKFIDYCLGETMTALEPYWKQAITSGEPFAAGNPAGAEYVLRNVSTPDLLKMARSKPVYVAMLSREGILHDQRHEAVMGLVKLNGADMMTELLAAMTRLDKSDSPAAQSVLFDLAHLFTMQPPEDFSKYRAEIVKLAESAQRPITRRVAYVTLIEADKSLDKVWQRAGDSFGKLRDLVDAVPLIQDAKLRAAAHARVEPLLFSLPEPLASQASGKQGTVGRYVRIEIPGRRKTLTLAEVEVMSGGRNIAPSGTAKQSATAHNGDAKRAIDGNKEGSYGAGGSTHTPEGRDNPWWELDLGSEQSIDAIVIWNRIDGDLGNRLDGYTLTVLDSARKPVFTKADQPAPAQSVKHELEGDPAGAIHRAAINAITYTGVEPEQTFNTLVKFVDNAKYRNAAIRALGRMPRRTWPQAQVRPLFDNLAAHVQEIPAADRTAPAVLDELALGNSLAAALPKSEAEQARKLLREIGVNVIRLRPVPHKMLYDRTDLFVEAGRQAEIVFENIDIMPHNLVIVKPGTLAKVGIAAEEMATGPDAFDKQFIPNLPDVLYATRMLQPGQVDRISFQAPSQVGEFPFVCTFPGHWRRMYGTLHVVENLDDVPPEALVPTIDPEIQSRPFVRDWKYEDLAASLSQAGHGRDFARGKELFTAISCVKCHKLNNEGGSVGPDLAGIKEKLAKREIKREDILRELVDPSKKIDEKYRTVVIVDGKGKLHTGIVAERNDKLVRLLSNPLDNQEPIELSTDDIEEEISSKVSLMPAGLLNTLTQDEILDLLMFIETAADEKHAAFDKSHAGHGR
jgi:putative heme-binding domain-containing protein